MTQELVVAREDEKRVRWRDTVFKLAKHYELEPEEIEVIYALLNAEASRE